MKDRVRAKQTEGVTFGRTPKVVEPIRPREEEERASGEMGQPRERRSASRRKSG